MKIVPIFEDKLHAFHYEGEEENEYDRLINSWYDPTYLYEFLTEHEADWQQNKDSQKCTKQQLVNLLLDDAEYIDDKLIEITESNEKQLSDFFKPLDNKEYKCDVQLSMQKGRKSYLRLYAIRIDDNIFVITGGAIKFHHLMEDKEHTKIELAKIKKARDYLKSQSVLDEDGFNDFLNEQE